ncbi:otospiralin-like [Polyodon spathula]|uniref:otospiralin-like n=1 Tax=Polyodon spathula TaxID=7913 RepID=UPI001B7EBE29|nr:otospiralin-like [Polyodon spathula]
MHYNCFCRVNYNTPVLGFTSHLKDRVHFLPIPFGLGMSGESQEKRSMPNWSGSASDFFAWVEQLRSHAGGVKMDELARIFWAHFPSASILGYEVPEPEK